MVDGNHTTRDWQMHAGKVCVWGVGSFEQHSVHLPLATDALFAEHFARCVARELGAALIPSLPLGTSLEHSGFRGTLSLRPETLMQIVRDVADEMERQAFTTLVLVNAHGGNHCLVPVVRDINRVDRRIKILLVNFWEFADPAPEGFESGPAFHADAWETSLLLAMRPDLVGAERVDMAPAQGSHVLSQGDLNTFGVGHLSPEGAAGSPSRASAETGRRILASIEKRLPAFVRDRVARLDRDRRYAGAGGIALRLMCESDIPDGMDLKEAAGWNQTEGDWRSFLEMAPNGCIAAVQNGKLMGTAAGIAYGNRYGWIGMVLVHPEFRRMGIGKRLMERCLAALGECECVGLDATPAGYPLYRKLGFVDEFAVCRLVCPCVPPWDGPGPGVEAARPADGDAMTALDAEVFGSRRPQVVARLATGAPGGAWKIAPGGSLLAFGLGRPGAKYDQVGPVIADSSEHAQAIVCAAACALRGRAAVIDVPEAQSGMIRWLGTFGFTVQRRLTRMRRGAAIPADPRRCYATAGPDLG